MNIVKSEIHGRYRAPFPTATLPTSPHRADGQHRADRGDGERGAPSLLEDTYLYQTDAMRFQIPIGDSYSTGYRIIVVSNVQPLTGLWGMVGNIIVLQICKP